jgi:transcriptional regulator with XRE-family HTH domain
MTEKGYELLRALRRGKNYSQEYMAHQLGVSQKAYSELENGKTKIRNGLVEKLADVLNVSAEKLCTISNCSLKQLRDKNLKLLALLKANNIDVPKDLI